MKKIFVLVFGLLTVAYAQSNKDALPLVTEYQLDEYSSFREANTPERVDLLYAPKLILTAVTGDGSDSLKYKYDSEGRVIRFDYVTYQGFRWYSYSYSYDTSGKLVLFNSYNNDKLSREQKWTYNSEGKPINLTDKNESQTIIVDYFYDIAGNETKRIEQYTPAIGGVSSRVMYSNYDSLNRVISRISFKGLDSTGVPEKRELFSYIETASTQELEIAVWKNLSWVNTEMFITYDSLSLTNSVTQRVWNLNTWKDSNRTIKRYTANGELKELRNEVYKEDKWVLYSTFYDQYDSIGRVIFYLSDYGENGNERHGYRTAYEYDSLNNVVTEEYQYWDGSTFKPGAKGWYDYDNMGNAKSGYHMVWSLGMVSDWRFGPGILHIRYNKGKDIQKHTAVFISVRYDSFTEIEDTKALPKEVTLSQNYPNPFNPSTTIAYSIASEGKVELKVYSMLGEEIATLVNEVKQAGSYTTDFNASKLPSGVYFYKLQSGDFVSTKKMVLVK